MKNILLILSFLEIFLIFCDGFTIKGLFPFDFRIEYIVHIIIIFLYIWKIKVNKKIVIFTIFFLIVQSIILIFDFSKYSYIVKQLIGISITFFAFYIIIQKNNVEKLFKLYMKIAIFMAIIGVFQQISFWLGIKMFSDFSWFLPNWRFDSYTYFMRVHALASEPSHYALVLVPAFFVAVYAVIDRKKRIIPLQYSIIIILCYIFTFSGVAFLGVFFSFIVILIDNLRFKIFVYSVLNCLMVILILYNSPLVKHRVSQSLQAVFIKSSLENVNLSTLTLLNNTYITLKSFKEHPIFGYGLGTYEKVYDKYSKTLSMPITELNKKEANSLFLRITAELGIMGIVIILIFIFGNFKPKKRFSNTKLYLINRASMVYLLLRFIRSGNYINMGLWFFIILICYSTILNFQEEKI